MNEEMRTRTYEELLINRVAKAFESMDNVNAEFFDEILEELEMLFKLKPDMYDQLIKWKQYHSSVSQQNFDLSKKKISMLEDEIAQEITMKYYQNKIEWSYRKDMLETMINILNEFKLIPFTNTEYAEIEQIESIEPEETAPEELEETPPPPPPPSIATKPVEQRPVEPIQKFAVNSPTIKPTNIPRTIYSEPPKQILDETDDALMREAERLAREEEEIKRAKEQPPRPAIPQKKGLGLFKRM